MSRTAERRQTGRPAVSGQTETPNSESDRHVRPPIRASSAPPSISGGGGGRTWHHRKEGCWGRGVGGNSLSHHPWANPAYASGAAIIVRYSVILFQLFRNSWQCTSPVPGDIPFKETAFSVSRRRSARPVRSAAADARFVLRSEGVALVFISGPLMAAEIGFQPSERSGRWPLFTAV